MRVSDTSVVVYDASTLLVHARGPGGIDELDLPVLLDLVERVLDTVNGHALPNVSRYV